MNGNLTDIVLREARFLAQLGLHLGTTVEFPMDVARPDEQTATALVRLGEIPMTIHASVHRGNAVRVLYMFESMFFTEPNKRALKIIADALVKAGRTTGSDLKPIRPNALSDMTMKAMAVLR